MALIFPRLAQNFIKNGYFPTDLDTIGRICSALQHSGQRLRLLDPCCGEGAALSEIHAYLTDADDACQVDTYGVEIDKERAWYAKTVLGTVAHADIHDMLIAPRSLGFLFLNPPYGDVVSDQAGLSERQSKDRHELVFCRRTFNLLQFGGVLALIVPHYIIDEELANLVARNFERVTVWLAPEQKFRQAVILGIKRRSQPPDSDIVTRLLAFRTNEFGRNTLPELWQDEQYVIPGIAQENGFSFVQNTVDGAQLAKEVDGLRASSLWPRFPLMFQQMGHRPRQPLMPPSKWHQALMLAAGQVTGKVMASDGRVLLIKGDTFKQKERRTELSTNDDGHVSETLILTDRFVPRIRAIDFTPGENLGRVITIA